MSKIISAYGQYTAAAIKAKATIPNQSSMVVSGSDVQCTDISIAGVHNGIQSSCLHLYGLCTSPRVNKWSNFSSREWYIDASYYLQNRPKTPYKLADFAGYNHSAVEAKILYNNSTKNAQITPISNTFSVQVALNSGEINWAAISGGQSIDKVCVKVYDHLGGLKTTKSIALSTFMKAGDQIPCIITDSITSTATVDETFYVMVYFGSFVEDLIAYYPSPVGTSPVVHHYSFVVKYLGDPTFSIAPDYSTFQGFNTMQTADISGSPSSVNVAGRNIYVRKDLKVLPPLMDCGGNGLFPRFTNSPLQYNADIKLVKGDTGQEYMFYNVIPSNATCVNYANIGTDNDNLPYQRIWFDYILPVEYPIFYGDHLFVTIKRTNSTFGMGYCSGGVPVYVP